MQIGRARVDAGVEQGDGHAAAGDAGEPDTGPRSARDRLPDRTEPDRCRVRGSNGIDALHARRPLDHGDRPRVEDRGEAVQRPRVAELGPARYTPSRPRFEMNCCCAAPRPTSSGARRVSLASPPARWTRSASEKAVSTTRTRWPASTGRARRRRARSRRPPPRAASATEAGRRLRPPGRPALRRRRVPRAARRRDALRHRIRVQAQRVGGGLRVPPGRGDHRGIVGAERERRSGRLRQRRAQLGIGGDAADDRDPVGAEPRRPAPSARRARGRSRAGTTPRGRRGAVRAPPPGDRGRRRGAPSSARRTRSRDPEPGRPGSRRRRDRPRGRAGRSRRRPDSRARAGARPCRTPRRPRRRASCRPPGTRRDPARRAAACGRRSRAGRGTAARGRSAGGTATRRARAGGRPATSGRPRPQAMPLAAASPTSSAPISPGPRVTATRSISSSVDARPVERLAHDRRDQLEVPPRGDLRNDPAEAGVQLGLGGDDVRPDLPRRRDDRRGGLVAGRLQAEDPCAFASRKR